MTPTAKLFSAALLGIDCQQVEVEVDVSAGLASMTIVGLGDTAIQEAKDRIRAALKNCFNFLVRGKIIINLAPADVRKEGPAYDLPIALGILATQNLVKTPVEKSLFIGELSLEGKLRPINGVLSMVTFAKEKGFKNVFLPLENASEGALMPEMNVYGVNNLQEIVRHLNQEEKLPRQQLTSVRLEDQITTLDFAYISGQEQAKRALEIAAAGGHNILLSGPPGSGKTLLSRSLPSVLPKMTFVEVLEVSRIYSVAGLLSHGKPLVTRRPFRSPHHSASGASLVGGGAIPRPGEISLAHRGVLFLDELPEFDRQVLENLRQPLEDGAIQIARARQTLSYPAKFSLVASMNPCPCGYLGSEEKECRCSPHEIDRYQKKISGPLLDRIDLQIEVPKVEYRKLKVKQLSEPSAVVRKRVELARQRQWRRFKELLVLTNAEMDSREIREYCPLGDKAEEILRTAAEKLNLSARGYFRVIKVARTIADLGNMEKISQAHLLEALQYRLKQAN